MRYEKTAFDGVYILHPKVFEDERGFFYESYSVNDFTINGLSYNFVQDNHSYNKHKNTLRGLHYQMQPKSQTTLVRVVSGEIIDFVVDIRKNSPTYGEYIAQNLSSKNHKQMLIPKGFAHGFVTLSDEVNILYKMDDEYSHEHDRILNIFDPSVDIKFYNEEKQFIISDKDKNAPLLKDIENNFEYGEID